MSNNESGNIDNQNAAAHSNENQLDNDILDEENSNGSNSTSQSEDNVEVVLSNFRQQWKQELKPKIQHSGKSRNDDHKQKNVTVFNNSDFINEEKAKELFLKGAELENAGNMYEAIQNYKKAVQLVPDIEFKLYDSLKKNNKLKVTNEKYSESPPDIKRLNLNETEIDDEDFNGEDLLGHIQRKLSQSVQLCFAEFEFQSTHISALPMEIILYILRWVVSTNLDMRSLEKFGSTCRGFYLCSRDSEIWRLACARVWGIKCGTLEGTAYGSWRDMFIHRPKLKFHGCYISKTTYIRHGENSFQDQFYRPWHLVEYYRYLRFFADGLVLMLTTADEPALCIPQLKYRNPKNPNILVGRYRQRDTHVTLIVQKQDQNKKLSHRTTRCKESTESNTPIFQLDLQIQSYKKRKHVQLSFIEYTVFTRSRGTQLRTNFELASARYPPLWFSRVKSYTAESDSPLQ